MEFLLLIKIFFSFAFLCVSTFFLHLCTLLFVNPQRLRSKLRKQGISGPSPSFLFGNVPQVKKIKSTVVKTPNKEHMTHDSASTIYPHFEQWKKEYGKIFTFSLGKVQLLYLTHPDVVKEMSLCTSLDLGKPAYQQKELGALLGQGILTSNGAIWAHQRKIIAPELYMEKVKGMVKLMVEASTILIKSWESKIESSEGGVADIRVDDDLRSFSSYIISKTLFGNSYAKGTDIFLRLRGIQKALSKSTIINGIPILRYLPTKDNREIWGLEKEVRSMILKIVKERTNDTTDQDLLQMIINGARNSHLRRDATEQFIVDNCKNIYLAGYETTAISTLWSLMLLASHPEWQARARAEVLQVCGDQMPNADMLPKMKTITMVIQEVLRLYPPAAHVSREVLQDMKFGEIHVPKGVNLWICVLNLHHDLEIWGPDAHEFNPERFANGLSSACKFPHAYIPFGVGPRRCVGQNFAMVELKIILALILSKFSFTLSPKYRHSPVSKMVIQPEHGVNLVIRRV